MKKKQAPKATPPHTPEPLRLASPVRGETAIWGPPSKELNGAPPVVAHCYDREDARRFVALWNACAGISTEALEGAKVADMVDSCKEMVEYWEAGDSALNWEAAIQQARAILAKFEGK